LTHRKKGELDLAMADFDRAIKHDPSLTVAWINRGSLWRHAGNYERALADFDKAVQSDPRSALARLSRALAYESKGDIARAQLDFHATLGIPARDERDRRAQATASARLAALSAAHPPKTPTANSAAESAATKAKAGVVARPGAGPVRRIALVIGNGSYANASNLPNPGNDARAIARSLREMGFEVSEGTDLDRPGMEKLLRAFLSASATARVSLLFYAGHGLQVGGKNYLVPVDAKIASATDFMFDTVELDKILAGLEDESRTNIIILDACRDNPLASRLAERTRSSSVGSGLASVSALGTGTLIAFAAAPGQVALDGSGPHSPFTAALLKHIASPGVELRTMLTHVRSEVVRATQNKQVPWDHSSLLDAVYLAGAR
jgi:hypothetical protein